MGDPYISFFNSKPYQCLNKVHKRLLKRTKIKSTYHMLSPEDRFAILDVIYAYNLAADKKDVEATLEHYVDEGYIDGDMSTGKGKAAMRKDLPSIFAAEVTLKRHIANNVRFLSVDESGDVTVQYVLLVMEAKAAPVSIATSIITDRFRRVDDTFKLLHHHVAVDPSARWLVKAGEKVVNAVETVKEKLK